MNCRTNKRETIRRRQARMNKQKQKQTLELRSPAQQIPSAPSSRTKPTSAPVPTTSHRSSTSRIMSKLKREKSLYQQTIQRRNLTRARKSSTMCSKCDCIEQKIIPKLQKKSLKQGSDDHSYLTRSQRSSADGGRMLRRHKQDLLKLRSSVRNSLMGAKRSCVDVCNTNDSTGGRRTSVCKKKRLKLQNASRNNLVRAKRNSTVECHTGDGDCTKDEGEGQRSRINREGSILASQTAHCDITGQADEPDTYTNNGTNQPVSKSSQESNCTEVLGHDLELSHSSERPKSPHVIIENVEEDFVETSSSLEVARSKNLTEVNKTLNVSVSQDLGVVDIHSLSSQPMNTETEINLKEMQFKGKKWEIRNDGLLITTSHTDSSKSAGKDLAVKMQPLPYQKIISTVLPCVPLDASIEGNRNRDQYLMKYNSLKASFVLVLFADLLAKIRKSKKPGQESYGIQVLVRMCIDDSSCVQNDAFPDCIIKVNNNSKTCVVVRNKDKTRKYDVPVDITQCCLDSEADVLDESEMSKPLSLCLSVEWKNDMKKEKNYCVTVVIAEELSIPQIISKLVKKHVKPVSITEKMVEEFFNSYLAKGLSCTSIRTSLNCPLGKTRIVTPCRGSSCTHIQCVDALTLLNMNEGRSVNNKLCLLCNQIMDSIYVDEFFLNILQSEQSEMVIFCEDGSWYMLSEDTETQQVTLAGTKTTLSAESSIKTEDVVCPSSSQHKLIEKSESRCSPEAEENIEVETEVAGPVNILSHLGRLQCQLKKLEGLHEDHNKVVVIDPDEKMEVPRLKAHDKDSLMRSEHVSDDNDVPMDCGSSGKSREILDKTNMGSNIADKPNEEILDLTKECTESLDIKENLSVNKDSEGMLDRTLEQEGDRDMKKNVFKSKKPNTPQLKETEIETQQRIKSIEDEISRLLKLSEFTKYERSWLFPTKNDGKKNYATVETLEVNDTKNEIKDLVPGKRKHRPESPPVKDDVNNKKVKNCSVVLERIWFLERTKYCTDEIDSKTTSQPNVLNHVLQNRCDNSNHRYLMLNSKRATADMITQQSSLKILSTNDSVEKTQQHSLLKSVQSEDMETQQSTVLKTYPSDSIKIQESSLQKCGPSDNIKTQKPSLLKSCPRVQKPGPNQCTKTKQSRLKKGSDNSIETCDCLETQQHSLLKSGPCDSMETQQSPVLKSHVCDNMKKQQSCVFNSGPSDNMKTLQSSTTKSGPSDNMETLPNSMTKSGPSDNLKTLQSSTSKSDASDNMKTVQSSMPKSGASDNMKTVQSSTPKSGPYDNIKALLNSGLSESMKSLQSSMLKSGPSDNMKTLQSSTTKSGPYDNIKTLFNSGLSESMKSLQSSLLQSGPSDNLKTLQSSVLKSDPSDNMKTLQTSKLKSDPSDNMKTLQSSTPQSGPSDNTNTVQSSTPKSGPSDNIKTLKSSTPKSGPSDSLTTQNSSLKSDASDNMKTKQSSKLKSDPSDSMKTKQSSKLKSDPSANMKTKQSTKLKSDPSDNMKTKQSSKLKSGPSDNMNTVQSSKLKSDPSDNMKTKQSSKLKSDPSDSMKTKQSSKLKSDPSDNMKTKQSSKLKSDPSDNMKTKQSSKLKSGPSDNMNTVQSSKLKSGPSDNMKTLKSSMPKTGPSDNMKTKQSSKLKSDACDNMKTKQSSTPKAGPSDNMKTKQSSTPKAGPSDNMKTKQSSTPKAGPSDNMKTKQSSTPKAGPSDNMKTLKSSTPKSGNSDNIKTHQSSMTKSGASDSVETQNSSLKSDFSDSMKTRQSSSLKSGPSNSLITKNSSLNSDFNDSMKTQQSSLLKSGTSDSVTTQQSSLLKSGTSDSVTTQQSSLLKSGTSDSVTTQQSSLLKSGTSDSVTTQQSSLLKSGTSDSVTTQQSSLLKSGTSDSVTTQQSSLLKSGTSDSVTTRQSSLLKSGTSDSVTTRQSSLLKSGTSDSVTTRQSSLLKSGTSDSVTTRQSFLLKTGPPDVLKQHFAGSMKTSYYAFSKGQRFNTSKKTEVASETTKLCTKVKSSNKITNSFKERRDLGNTSEYTEIDLTNDEINDVNSSPKTMLLDLTCDSETEILSDISDDSDIMIITLDIEKDNELKEGCVNSDDELKEGCVNSDDVLKEGCVNSNDELKEGCVNSDDEIEEGCVNSNDELKEGCVNSNDELKEGCVNSDDELKEGCVNSNDELKEGCVNSDDELKEGCVNSNDELKEGCVNSNDELKEGCVNSNDELKEGCVNSVPAEQSHASIGDLSNQSINIDLNDDKGNINEGKVMESYSNKALQTKHDTNRDMMVLRSAYSREKDKMQTPDKLQTKDSTNISEVSERTCQCNKPLKSQSCKKCNQYVVYIVKRNKQLVPVTLTSESCTEETDLKHSVRLHNEQLKERMKECKKAKTSSQSIKKTKNVHDKDQSLPTSQKRNKASKHLEHSKNQCENSQDTHMEEEDEFTCRNEMIRRRKQIRRERRKLIVDRQTTMKQTEIDANQFFHYQTSQRPELAPTSKIQMRDMKEGILGGPLKLPGKSIPSKQLQRLFYRNTKTNLDEALETVMEDQTANQAELQ